MTMLFILAYIFIAFGFCFWDAVIGTSIEWDGLDSPPLAVAAIFWPAAAIYALLFNFIKICDKLKEKRIVRENLTKIAKEKIRIKEETLQQELEALDYELSKGIRNSSTREYK